MILNWFDAREAVRMGEKLAADLASELNKQPRKSGKQDGLTEQKVEKIFSQLQAFKREHPLNFYKKAKLMNTFKWQLLERDYDPQLVETLTKKLMFYV